MSIKLNSKSGIYQITVMRDGVKSSDHYYEHAVDAVEAWAKFSDYGDAKELRTIIFIPPIGEIRTKTFYAKQPRGAKD
jgi:hypothetical protein